MKEAWHHFLPQKKYESNTVFHKRRRFCTLGRWRENIIYQNCDDDFSISLWYYKKTRSCL